MTTFTTKFSIGDKVVPAAYYCNGGKVGTVRRVLVHETPVGVQVKYAVQYQSMYVEEYHERDLTTGAITVRTLDRSVDLTLAPMASTVVSPHYFQD